MRIYLASSWKNQHAVELLTEALRARGHEILSFVENNYGEGAAATAKGGEKAEPFEVWVQGPRGERAFRYDTGGATKADLVIYVGPSGCDAWAEIGAAWASGRTILGLWAKGEPVGLMRRMVQWHDDFRTLLSAVDLYADLFRQGVPFAATSAEGVGA